MVILILIVLGVCFGSFINAFVWRFRRQSEIRDGLPFEETIPAAGSPAADSASVSAMGDTVALSDSAKLSIVRGHSMCVRCGHPLVSRDLIPVVSYLLLRGKCRYCRKPIHDTPVPELLTPLLFVLSYLYWPLPLTPYDGRYDALGMFSFVMWLAFLVGFVILSLYDYYWHELPHDIVFPLICLAVFQAVIIATVYGGGWSSALHAVYGAATCAGVFCILYWISPKAPLHPDMPDQDNPDPDITGLDPGKVGIGTLVCSVVLGRLLGSRDSLWIGGGDITLAILLGLLVGGPANALLLIFIASLIGTVLALPLMALGKATRSSHLPFGPMLMTAAVIVMLFGTTIIGWYTSQFIS